MALTREAVLALAPDAASAKAAQGLLAATQWPTLGSSDAAVWGECQGSGAKPYQTQVDLAGPAFRCSCPSRKFPCKHGLALLLLQAQNPGLFAAAAAPAWVTEWLATRAAKAQQQQERAADKPATPADPQAAAAREAQRWQRIEAAAGELQRWLADQLARGLGALNQELLKTWQTMAARLVDAQAPGLAQRLRDAAASAAAGPDAAERTLHRLGLLQLACDALQRRASLGPALQAELRSLAGWPQDKAEVLATGEAVADRWTVLGAVTDTREDKLVERRVWLQGARSGRRAWLLDHAYGGRGFEQNWLTGTSVEVSLHYFPGTAGLRALCGTAPASLGAPAWPVPAPEDELLQLARRCAASPWVGLHPLLLADAVPLHLGAQAVAVAAGRAWPLQVSDSDRWTLVACSGGQPATLMGEWDGVALQPLTAWRPGAATPLWQRSLA